MRDKHGGFEWDMAFDVSAEAGEVSRLSRLRRKHRFRRSVVDRCRGELGALYAAGLSLGQLALWLWRRKRLRVSRATLHRRMQTWPEVVIRRRRRG